jgi:hypothetical protein
MDGCLSRSTTSTRPRLNRPCARSTVRLYLWLLLLLLTSIDVDRLTRLSTLSEEYLERATEDLNTRKMLRPLLDAVRRLRSPRRK